MKIVENLSDIPQLPEPLGLTIGSFDGVHLGHLALLQHLRKKATKQGTMAVLTFKNHPATVLKNREAPTLLCTLEQNLSLLEEAGVDLVILLPFSKETAQLSFQAFLQEIRNVYPFSFLVLGKGSRFGKNAEGDEKQILELAKKWGFSAEYIEKLKIEDETVSSGAIRKALEERNFKKATSFLGRSLNCSL